MVNYKDEVIKVLTLKEEGLDKACGPYKGKITKLKSVELFKDMVNNIMQTSFESPIRALEIPRNTQVIMKAYVNQQIKT